MLQLNFTTEEWKHTPEVATILYSAFGHRRSKQSIRECVDTSDLLLVTRHYGHVAGFCMFRVAFENHDWPVLSWLAVAKCFRRWGVGTAIAEYVYENCGKHVLSVANENDAAIKFYTKLGYKKYGESMSKNFSWYYRR